MTYTFQVGSVLRYLPMLLQGLAVTFLVGYSAGVAGLLTAWVVAFASMSRFSMIRWLSIAYIEVWRNTPLLMQLYLVYFGFTSVTGVSFTPLQAGLIAIILNTTAYNAEILRGGLQSISRKQIEAAESLGLGRFAIARAILIPWTMKAVFPSLANQFILVLLGTSVLSLISIPDLMHHAKHLQAITGRTIELYLIATLLYVTVILLSSALFGFLESRFFTLGPKRIKSIRNASIA